MSKVEEFGTTGKIALLEELIGNKDEISKKAEEAAKEKAQGAAFTFID